MVLVILCILFSKSYRAENGFTCNSIMTWRHIILRHLIDSITYTVIMSSSVHFISAASVVFKSSNESSFLTATKSIVYDEKITAKEKKTTNIKFRGTNLSGIGTS